jgi:hypothetical protein
MVVHDVYVEEKTVAKYRGLTHMRETLLVYLVIKSHLLNGMVNVEEHVS